MHESQIFISHASGDIDCAARLYEDLLDARYWIWMDKKNLRAAEKWELQIEENLRKSRTFIVLFSSKSVQSDWVKHEGSMAFALNQLIIPVNIEPSRAYSTNALPIWAKPIQLIDIFPASVEYTDQLQNLKQLLGEPLSIRKHLLEMLDHYQRDKVLLDEVALDLVLRHYSDLHLTKEQKTVADKLIEESIRKLDNYWVRYDKLQNDVENLTEENQSLKSDRLFNFAFICLLYIIFFSFLYFLFFIVFNYG